MVGEKGLLDFVLGLDYMYISCPKIKKKKNKATEMAHSLKSLHYRFKTQILALER